VTTTLAEERWSGKTGVVLRRKDSSKSNHFNSFQHKTGQGHTGPPVMVIPAVSADLLAELVVQINHQLPSQPNHASGRWQPQDPYNTRTSSEEHSSSVPRISYPCASTSEHESTSTHLKKLCLQLCLR